MKMKLKKYLLYFANKKGILFLYEVLFIMLIMVSFILAYTKIDLSLKTNDIINYYKFTDILTVSVANQLNETEIKDLIESFYNNVDYEIIGDKTYKKITNKLECYSKEISQWKNYPLEIKKLYIRICF